MRLSVDPVIEKHEKTVKTSTKHHIGYCYRFDNNTWALEVWAWVKI